MFEKQMLRSMKFFRQFLEPCIVSLVITIPVMTILLMPSSYYGSVKVNSQLVLDRILVQALVNGQCGRPTPYTPSKVTLSTLWLLHPVITQILHKKQGGHDSNTIIQDRTIATNPHGVRNVLTDKTFMSIIVGAISALVLRIMI